jgi:hypothetical protein
MLRNKLDAVGGITAQSTKEMAFMFSLDRVRVSSLVSS